MEPTSEVIEKNSQIEKAVAVSLYGQLVPVVNTLDESVKRTRASQARLRSQLDSLAEDLRHAAALHSSSYPCEPYINKIRECKKRLAVVAGILQSSQDRLMKLRAAVEKETTKRKALLEQPLPNPP